MSVRARAVGLAARGQRAERALLVAVGSAPPRRVRAAGGGHGCVARDRGGVPRRPGRPAVAGAGLGRGPRGRRPARALPPVRAGARSTTSTCQRLLGSGHAYRCYCTPQELEERNDGGEAARRGARLRRPLPRPDGRAARGARGRRPDPHDPLPDARRRVGAARPGQGRRSLGAGAAAGLRAAAGRRVAAVPARGGGGRHADGHHPRRARRRPPELGAPQHRGDRGPRRDRARLRAPPPGRGGRPQAAVEAARLDERPGVPRAGVRPRGDGELPRAAGVVGGRRSRGLRPGRAGRHVRPGARVVEPRGVRHREAHVAQQPLHPADPRRRPGRPLRALPHRGRARASIRSSCDGRCRW